MQNLVVAVSVMMSRARAAREMPLAELRGQRPDLRKKALKLASVEQPR
jgi:hypothetical protein